VSAGDEKIRSLGPARAQLNQSAHALLRIMLGGLNDIEEWRLGNAALAAAKNYPRGFPAEFVDDCGILFVDIAIDAASGDVVCHEVNGANGVGSDALTGDSAFRALNEAQQAMRRAKELGYLVPDGSLRRPVVTLHAHQHWAFFRTGGEFFPRVDQFGHCLSELLPGNETQLRGAFEELGDEAISVVFGEVPAVAAHLTVDQETGRFLFRDRPVIFIGNPNLVAELVRLGRVRREKGSYKGVDLRVLHGWRLVPVIHDKAMQQDLFRHTGIRPLHYFEAMTADEALPLTKQALEAGPIVLKPNAGSGGAGIHVVVPGMDDDELRARIAAVFGDCRAKYGGNVESFVLPLRGFEFVRSTAFPMADGGHVWDLRIAVMFEPARAQAFPVSFRLAPRPFDPQTFHNDRDQWISNVGGRQVTLLKSGMDDAALEAVGFTQEKMDLALQASVRWLLKAYDAAIRGGGIKGNVHEDACEAADPSFYPVEKFGAR
jgi:hypothetical protein